MSRLPVFIVTLLLLVFQNINAQRNYDEYNKLGIQAGLVSFDIMTDDFMTTKADGFGGGFTSRGSFRNAFDLIYGLNFMGSAVSIAGSDGARSQNIDFTIQAVQLQFLGSLNIIKHHLSLEFGPTLNVSSKMKVKREAQENFIIDGYQELTAKDLENISPINFRMVGGLSAGIEGFRATAQYQYGVTNILNRLNDQGLEKTNFEGNSGTLFIGAVIYF